MYICELWKFADSTPIPVHNTMIFFLELFIQEKYVFTTKQEEQSIN